MILEGFNVHLKDMCPSKGGSQNLSDYVRISDPKVAARVQQIICQAPAVWLDLAEQHFLSNLDFFRPVRVRSAGPDLNLPRFINVFPKLMVHHGRAALSAVCQAPAAEWLL